jgi:predicted Zn finger-like uncharacterized protein
MQIACPNCQAQLRMPDAALGKKVRCPKCQHAFVASEEKRGPAVVKLVAPPKPKAPPPLDEELEAEEAPPARRRRRDEDDEVAEAPRRKRRPVDDDDDEDDEPRSRRRRRDEEDDEDDDRPRRRRRDEDDEDEEEAEVEDRGDRRRVVGKARRAALVMYVACGFYFANIATNIVIALSTMNSIPAPPGQNAQAFRIGVLAGAVVCGPVIWLTLLALIGVGALKLSKMQGRAFVITAIVLCFLIALIQVAGAVVNIIGLSNSNLVVSRGSMLLTIGFNTVTAVVMLAGGILATVALSDRGVQASYASRRRRL